MYDIRQFRATLYILLMMGVTGFALAAESPGIWVVGAGGILLNAWLVKTRRFTPMPRMIANAVTLGALALVALEVRAGDATPIITVGQFIVLLHLVKLFEQRANRDYAQLLVLSLLLMVAAAISTASLAFGIIFILYMFVSLHCCLLFHLKVEVDQARLAYRQPVDPTNPGLARLDMSELPKSMRRLTGLISVAGIAMAVLIFLFFPRGAGQTLFGPVQMRASQALTGFTDQVSFQKVAAITRSEDVVARVELFHKGVRVRQPMEMRLRGSVLDVYTGNDLSRGARWQWYRSENLERFGESVDLIAGEPRILAADTSGEWVQVINLEPTGTNKLFAMAGPVAITPSREMRIRFSASDGVLESETALLQPIKYTINSSGQLPSTVLEGGDDPGARSVIDPVIARFARQPAVCGTDAGGKPLAEYPLAGNHAFDHQIATNLEIYLRTNYEFTLDLTNLGSLGDKDPMAAFLTEFKRGHCEYFAGAMTLMCQSLGIPARFIVGFRCDPDDFNSLGDYFVVKQSNAHAWCEVLTGEKWETFDPTSGRLAIGASNRDYFSDLKKIFDYLEFKWATSVVAYDTENRKNFIENLNLQVDRSAVSGSQSLQDWMDRFKENVASAPVLTDVITGMIGLSFVAIGYFMVDRWRLRRRARRIGLESLSAPDRLRLIRQLGFYDDLLRILERHHIERPRHLTPLEFSRSLTYLPGGVYDDIHRLTELFYRIRYGGSEPRPYPRRHLASVISRIQQSLDAAERPSDEHDPS